MDPSRWTLSIGNIAHGRMVVRTASRIAITPLSGLLRSALLVSQALSWRRSGMSWDRSGIPLLEYQTKRTPYCAAVCGGEAVFSIRAVAGCWMKPTRGLFRHPLPDA
jgi:hypothetical protein